MPLLTGCKAPWQSKRQASSTSASAGGAAGAPAAPQGWQQLDGHIAGHHIIVNVSPIIRKDESTSILALELFRASDDKNRTENKPTSSTPENKFTIVDYWGSRANLQPGNGVSAVRIMDLQTGRVWNSINGSKADPGIAPGEKITYYVAFGKIDSEQVTVFVPMAGFVTVSVLEAGSAQQAKIDLSAAQTELDTLPNTTLAASAPIERYTRSLDDSTSTHTGGKDITVTLASDVTFASDSADLTPAADTQLQTVATQLKQHPDGGTLTIVGHTDDIQDDAYNQTLSDKRANAVKTKLQQLTKLDKWKTSVSGKGESQPKIKDTTDEARAANRRVEITLTPTGGTTPKNSTTTPSNGGGSTSGSGSDKLPDPQGPAAKGPEGVTLTSKGTSTSGEVTITLDHLTRTGGYLLGTITCTVKDGSTGAPLHPLLEDPQTVLANQRDESGSALPTFNASDGLTLLAGGERIFPADYLDADAGHHLPLTELRLLDHLKTGTTTICVVWPDPGGDTVTLDHPEGKYSPKGTAYRLTDIPIKNS